MQVSLKQLEACVDRYEQWKSKDAETSLYESARKRAVVDGVSDDQNLEQRKNMLRDSGLEPVDFAFERAIGQNDSVYSNFIETIQTAKRKVGRIVIKRSNTILGYATGFMVSERLLLTNWHVFKQKEDALDSEVQFGYEYDGSGRPKTPHIFKLAPKDFFYSFEKLDYCIVAVNPLDDQGRLPITEIGYHYLNPTLGKLAGEGQEFVNIIHHPDGDYMQLSIRENKFVKIQEHTLWYEADTSQGSSGSPVFNDQFQVVALHHMGVPKKSEDGKHYVDKDDKPILPENGKIDTRRIVWIANEGIRISKLTAHFFAQFPDHSLVKGMQKPFVPASTGNQGAAMENVQTASQTNTDAILISIPNATLMASGVVQVTVQNQATNMQTGGASVGVSGSVVDPQLMEELEKATAEQQVDYSSCQGYDPAYMGVKLPLPEPNKVLRPFAAKRKDVPEEIELKYYYYSVIQHAIRKMPMVSAINVDGDPAKRRDDSEREDKWLRDVRIDLEAQLTDKFYANSGFDKGHMSRREDANYADDPEKAKLYADMTCMHTNACPQVGRLNRSSSKGLWGRLEKVILEKGVSVESGKQSRISVYNGPIFAESDPVFRGVQIPMEFWKMVVWRDDKNKLKATAFKLTQVPLVTDINFEAIDVDKNIEFREFQISIEQLAALTGLDFSAYRKYDTFGKKTKAKKEVKLETEEALLEMLAV
ncbi:MAG TPA: DNA/RNA non-specific endonuclease [Saprospiraceae bacterium]|nr:DNA/RNA non-specific endonuclease [Saprospiraceae bacterium]